jgi:hypothetical protein
MLQLQLFVCFTVFEKGGVDDSYGMRSVKRTGQKNFLKIVVSLDASTTYLYWELMRREVINRT